VRWNQPAEDENMAYDLNLCVPGAQPDPAAVARWEQELAADATIAPLCEITRISSRARAGEEATGGTFAVVRLPRDRQAAAAAYAELVHFAMQRNLKLFDPQVGDFLPLSKPGSLPPLMTPAQPAGTSLPDSRPGPVKLFLGGLFMVALGTFMLLCKPPPFATTVAVVTLAFGVLGFVACIKVYLSGKKDR
jgi:hypothetical protein